MKKNEKLLDILGEVDDRHIPADTGKKPTGKNIIKWTSVTAALGAAAAIGIFALGAIGDTGNVKNIPAVTEGGDLPAITSETQQSDSSVYETNASDIQNDVIEDKRVDYVRTRRSTVVADITADSVRGDNALTDTSFTIRSTADITAEEMMNRLAISPAADFKVVRRAECEYLLTASAEFAKGSVVKLSVEAEDGGRGDCWAFRIIDDLRVVDFYPADGVDSVSIDSGIEINFPESVDEDEAKAHFSVSPALSGSFITRGNMLCFMPSGMEYGTSYTVTVSAGVKAQSGVTMKEPFSFTFKTTSVPLKTSNHIGTTGISETFLQGDPIVIELSDSFSEQAIDVALYRFGSSDDYMSTLYDYCNKAEMMTVDTEGLDEVFTSCEPPMRKEGVQYGPSFVMLPYDLGEGYYVARLKRHSVEAYYFIEINPISVYSANFGSRTLFYINDTITGRAAEDAEITLHTSKKSFTVRADKNGAAIIDTGDNSKRHDIIEINYDGHRYIDLLYNNWRKVGSYDSLYYSYLYTDREAYLSTDTINVWGILKPRSEGGRIPENVYLCFSDNYGDDLIKYADLVKVDIAADGTFSASISYTDRVSLRWRSKLFLLDGDNDNAVICQKFIQVLDYVKPTYTFDVTLPDYLILPQENPFSAVVEAKYFDGTPAKGLTFETGYSIKKTVSGELTTNEQGIISPELLAHDYGENSSGMPIALGVTFTLTGIEDEYQSSFDYVTCFFRDAMLTWDYDSKSKTAEIRTNMIDFDKIPEYLEAAKAPSLYYSQSLGKENCDILRGEAYDTEVRVDVRRSYWEKKEAGTYYNFIEKKTMKSYEYISRSEEFGTFGVNTKNGFAVFDGVPFDKDGTYIVTITYKDSAGRESSITEYVYNSEYKIARDIDYRSFYLSNESMRFKEDEDISFTLKESYHNGIDELDGKVLFVSYQDDIIDAVIYNSTDFSYKADKRCIPNFDVCGAYFDGRHVYPLAAKWLYFDPEERGITLSVDTDREKYDAGDEVTLTVTARDISGRAVSGAAVTLSVVDEAAFAINDQNVELLRSLYRGVDYYGATQNCSYVQHVLEGEPMGEKGGSDDELSLRKDFRDNPYFGTVKADGEGRAVIKFKLADTITTWRATVLAFGDIGGRLYAGSTKYQIRATRPVFITPIMLSEYTEGDDIAVTAKCVGLNSGDMITVTLSGGGADKTLKIRPCMTANFGKLPVGEYKVTFSARSGENGDAMELPLSVTASKHEIWVDRSFSGAEGIAGLNSIKPSKWPVSLTFFDKQYMFCKSVLQEVARYYGENTVRTAAAEFAKNELGWQETDYQSMIASMTSNGVAKPLKNGNPDFKATAMLCAAFPEYVSADAVANAFSRKIKECSYEELVCCYMGLAALGKPVLDDIDKLIDLRDDTLTRRQKLYLAAGLVLGGDFNRAYRHYRALTEDMSFYEHGGELYACLDSRDEARAALIAASVMNLPEAELLARGLMSPWSKIGEDYALEFTVYIRNYVPAISGDATISFNENGVRRTVALSRYGRCSLRLDKERFENADIRIESGDVLIDAHYLGGIDELDTEPSLTVTKRYEKTDAEPGEKIKVTIITAPNKQIEDMIPSCARLYGSPGGSFSQEGQKISLRTNDTGIVSYYICMTTSGEFVTEPAYAYYSKGWGISDSGTITVRSVDGDV